jgi:uridine kinase
MNNKELLNNMIDTVKKLIKQIKERWIAIKAILKGDEYFVVISKQKETNDRVIYYEYIKNTDRDLFYKFVKDHIDKKFKTNV